MKAFLSKVRARLRCFIQGHPTVPTGRHSLLLHEHRCARCGRLFISHSGPEGNYGKRLLPANPESDRLFDDYANGFYWRKQ